MKVHFAQGGCSGVDRGPSDKCGWLGGVRSALCVVWCCVVLSCVVLSGMFLCCVVLFILNFYIRLLLFIIVFHLVILVCFNAFLYLKNGYYDLNDLCIYFSCFFGNFL